MDCIHKYSPALRRTVTWIPALVLVLGMHSACCISATAQTALSKETEAAGKTDMAPVKTETDSVKTLAAEVIRFAEKAAEDGAITYEARDSIETRYDRMGVPDRGTTAPDRQTISSILPGVLPLPDDFVDRQTERFRKEMAAAMTVKDLTAQYLERIKPWQPRNRYLQGLYFLLCHFIPTNGMDPSFKSVAVMNGLYYIPCVPGQPLEFDESIFKDTKHFDPLVYRPTKPQMEYDLGEGLHFRAYSTPDTGGAALPNVISGEYATPPNRQ